ncbi:MAG: SCO family protein [Caldilineaceae bacterium]
MKTSRKWRVASLEGSGRFRLHRLPIYLLLLLLLFIVLTGRALAHDPALHPTQILDAIGFDQRLDAQAPLDLPFRDETGRTVALGDYFRDKPVVLSLGYWECPNLCSLSRAGLLQSLEELDFSVGQEFAIVMVSIDPAETPTLAATIKQQHVISYNRSGSEAGWHFLSGDHEAIDRLADAVGFRYAYDAEQEEYAHVSGLVVLTPAGKVARYLYGIDYDPRDLRLSLIEAASNRIGKFADQVLLFCYTYNPVTGRYSLLLMRVMQTAAGLTVAFLGGVLWLLLRNERTPMSTRES